MLSGSAVPTRQYHRSRLLKNRVILTEGGNAGDRVISEARLIWSHLLIPSPRKSFPNTVPSLCRGPEHHDLIHGATMSFDSSVR